MAALSRIEILKEGAAATYGSDAIAGVVNFITDSTFEGLRVNIAGKSIPNTEGDGNEFSITYGQIFLETDLFNAGIRPAINAGLSVSRVGGAAQTKIIKKLGGGVRLALAQYRELAAFSQFASDLDEATRKQLERGKRVTELMKQSQYSPLSVADMAISLFAANEGFLDEVPLDKIIVFEKALHEFSSDKHAELVNEINVNCDYNDEIAAKLKTLMEDFIEKGVY